MWQLRQVLKFVLGLLGAVVLAAAVAAVPEPGGHYQLRFVFVRIADFLQFRFGASSITGLPAAQEVAARLPATLELIAIGAVIAFLLGAPLGFLLGRGRGLRAAALLVQLIAAAPVFCAGLGLIWLAARVFHWTYMPQPLPWPAMAAGGATALAALKALSLPGLTVGAAGASVVQLAVRRAESEASDDPYRQGLRLLGLGSFEIDRLYLVPQVFAGLLASFGEIILALFSAAAVAEWLFRWPGAAALFVKSVALRDWNLTALILLTIAAISLLADLCGAIAARAFGGVEP
ncbi:MAG: ABC transporter permease subunit [Rhizomicrobium sp.]|jgi:peptide/nickel transport system permease protein